VTYGAVDPGALVVVVGSWDLVEIAVRDGSARAALGAAVGDAVVIGERSS
jgi:S-adenosylmethionine hydrolase